MAKQKRRKPKPQQRSAEPTVAQQREEWRRAKAEDEALEELGLMLDLEGREPPKYDVVAGVDARDQIDRLELLLAYYRWTVADRDDAAARGLGGQRGLAAPGRRRRAVRLVGRRSSTRAGSRTGC